MKVLSFRYSGRFGLFVRAESKVSWLSYPVPPRTALLGLLGAVLGLEKDAPQGLLGGAYVGVKGEHPRTHWHHAQLHKRLFPPPQPKQVKWTKKKADLESKEEKEAKGNTELPTLMMQEWLLGPDYQVFAGLPSPYHEELKERLIERRWCYGVSLGLSEMLGDLEYIGEEESERCGEGVYDIATVCRMDEGELQAKEALERRLFLQQLQMPREVTEDRVFTMCSYLAERRGQALPVWTQSAYHWGRSHISFL